MAQPNIIDISATLQDGITSANGFHNSGTIIDPCRIRYKRKCYWNT